MRTTDLRLGTSRVWPDKDVWVDPRKRLAAQVDRQRDIREARETRTDMLVARERTPGRRWDIIQARSLAHNALRLRDLYDGSLERLMVKSRLYNLHALEDRRPR